MGKNNRLDSSIACAIDQTRKKLFTILMHIWFIFVQSVQYITNYKMSFFLHRLTMHTDKMSCLASRKLFYYIKKKATTWTFYNRKQKSRFCVIHILLKRIHNTIHCNIYIYMFLPLVIWTFWLQTNNIHSRSSYNL